MLNNLKKFIAENKFNLAIFLLYLIISFTAMFYHEIWRDEARVWNFLLSSDIKTIFNNIRFDGHPYLWYIVLFPFVKIGFNFFTMQVISVLLCSAAVLFFLVKSPFNYLIKILFVFSAGMIYYLPVVARNYALVPLCIFLLAYLYPERHNKPYKYLTALVLVSQTHCLMWGLFGICSFVFLIECVYKYIKEKNKSFIIVPFVIVLYYISMFFIYIDVFYKNGWNPELVTSFFSFSNNDIYEAMGMFSILNEYDINKIVLILLAVLLVAMGVSLLKRSKKAVLFLIFSTFFIFYVSLKVWYGGIFYQKFFLIILTVIFCYWISDSKDNVFSKISDWILTLFLFLLLFSPFFVNIIREEIQNTYTNTKEICNFIESKDEKNLNLVIYDKDGIIPDTFAVFLKDEFNYINIPSSDDEKYVLKGEDIMNDNEFPKYVAITSSIIIPEEMPYRQVISEPKNRVKIYNTKEYYSLYEKTE